MESAHGQLSGPSLAAVPEPHLLAPLWRWADTEPRRPLLAARDGDRFREMDAEAFRQTVREVAAGLIARGVGPGDRVALLARTSLDWVVADHAVLAAGAACVPIYDTSSTDQIQRILADSGAVIALVETDVMAKTIGEDATGATGAAPLSFESGAMDRLREGGRDHLDEVERRIAALRGEDLAALIYSSGTTGEPKGCELTHGNLCANAAQTAQQVPELFLDGARTLVFLPLAHALARIQVHAAIAQGVLTGFASSIEQLPDELAMFRPTFIVAVPRIFEKVHRAASLKAAAGGKQAIFDRAADVAVRWSRARRSGPVPVGLRLQHALFDRLVYGKLRAAFGGELRLAICGGAPLAGDLARFFDGVGVTILQGYGLTEASPIVSGGPVDPVDHDTVGRLYPGTEVRIADDGEILVRGPQVFRGYRGDPQATAAILRDGWLYTGDLGAFTPAGYLVITGRKKDIIVTAGGKNVAPGPLEDRLRAHPLIDQCVVVGEGRPFVGALVFLDAEEVARREREGETVDEPALRTELERAVAAVNATVSRGEAIRTFRVVPTTLTIDAGEITPTLKLRRAVITERFDDEIDAIYGP
ncbi:MAG TPA: long-chain fatty acid--CoA ligase [Egicoccus sp.]|nr:long-chain fatty acid--CoA ligase [Egicoccus sp.]HSK23796.1 long-chain fatty acid--CoA ligase [Egicoccus sp.]